MLHLKEKGKAWDLRGKGRRIRNSRKSSDTATLKPAQTTLSPWPLSLPPHPFYEKKKNGVTHVFCSSCQSAPQCASCTQSTKSSRPLPVINIKITVSWQQIFHSGTHFILQSFLVKIKCQRNVIIYSKDFQSSPFQLKHSIPLPSKLQLISIYYTKRTALAAGITGTGSQAAGRDGRVQK